MMNNLNDKLISNTCCLCRDERYEKPYKNISGYELVKCSLCELVFLKRYPPHLFEFLNDVEYSRRSQSNSDLEFWSVPQFYSQYRNIFEHFFHKRLNNVLRFTKLDLGTLDVGSGYGFWIKYLNDRGVTAEGVEVDKKAYKYSINNYGLNIHNDTYENFQADNTYSLITMVDVLEHFQQPESAVAKAGKMLNKGGVLFIQVPNVLGLKIPRGHSYGLPYHLWQFSYRTLQKLLEKQGFSIAKSWTGVQGVIGKHEKKEVNFMTKSMWTLAEAFHIGNRLHVIARKE